MNTGEITARLEVDISGFTEGMQAAVAIAQRAAGDLSQAFASITNFDSLTHGAVKASQGAADSIANTFLPLTDAGARMFSAWLRGGRDLKREFADIVQSLITDLAKSGLQDLMFGARSGSLLTGIVGTRGKDGLVDRGAGAVDSSAIQKALSAAWQGVSGIIGGVLRSAFQSISGFLAGIFGNALSSAAGSALSSGASGAVSVLSGAAGSAAEASALAANTAALGVLTAAVTANTVAAEQLAIATEIDAAANAISLAGGGVVPSAAGGMVLGGRGTLAILHPREMVLPAPLSEGIQSAISHGGLGGSAGGDVHVHIGSIHGGDASDMRRELDRFADKIGDIVREQHRANRFLKNRY